MDDSQTPEAIANQALDAAGLPELFVGNLNEGTAAARVILRSYVECVRQLLRGVHWDFARKDAPLQMVADASGQTSGVGTLVPSGFLYSYAYPTDCAKVRFIPANYIGTTVPVPEGNITPPNNTAPLTAVSGQPPVWGVPLMPSRFLITNDPNYVPPDTANNTPGVAPVGQTLILSNVKNARCIYTFEAYYPNLWDALFREAMVAFLAAKIAFALHKDKKLGRAIRSDQIAIAMGAVKQAATTNGNESWSNADLTVDWMRFRSSGGWQGNWGSAFGMGPGYLFGGTDPIGWGVTGLGNTSAF